MRVEQIKIQRVERFKIIISRSRIDRRLMPVYKIIIERNHLGPQQVCHKMYRQPLAGGCLAGRRGTGQQYHPGTLGAYRVRYLSKHF